MAKRQSTEIQTLIFEKPGFNRLTALSWARRHNFKASKTDSKKKTIRIRQHAPGLFKKNSFRTILLKPRIMAVIGKRKIKHKSTR